MDGVDTEREQSAWRPVAVSGMLVLVALLCAAGCSIPAADGGSEVRDGSAWVVNGSGVQTLDLETINGACEVRGWDNPEISVRATKRSLYGTAELGRVSLNVTEGPTLGIRTVHPQPTARVSVDYVIRVPPSVGSIRIGTSNGAVLVEGVAGTISAESSNGAVRILGTGGDVEARSSNGPIEVRGANGTVTARTSNGPLSVDDAAGIGDLETSAGRLEADVRSVRGPVTVRNSNGSIELTLSPGLDAEIDAETTNGRIAVPAGLLTVAEQSDSRLRATAGDGGSRITIRTTNGDVRLTSHA